MEFGLHEKDIQLIRAVFAKHPEVHTVILYGSRAKGNYRPSSDIDLTLIGESLTLDIQFAIDREIYELPIPYKCDISILKQIDNPDLVDHIRRVGKVFYKKA